MATNIDQIEWDFSGSQRVEVFTQAHLNTMQALLDSGNRGGAYMYYYMRTGNPQALVQAQITTGSGGFSGAADIF